MTCSAVGVSALGLFTACAGAPGFRLTDPDSSCWSNLAGTSESMRSEAARCHDASAPRVVVVETTARPCARAVHRPGPFRTTTAQRAPRRRSLWPTKGKRSPPPPPPLAPVGWDERATAAPGGSGARRDLQEIRSFAGRGRVMLSNTIRIRPRWSFSYPNHSQFGALRVCVSIVSRDALHAHIWIAMLDFVERGGGDGNEWVIGQDR